MTKSAHSTAPEILVVGATGNLGSRLVRQLTAADVKPRALVRSREKAQVIAPFATPVIGDLMAPRSLADAFRGAERVFVVAPPRPEMESLERNAIDAAVAAGAQRIVYLSNFLAAEGAEDRPWHVHGLHEHLLTTLHIKWTVLRPTRYMTHVPFVWPSLWNRGVLLEPGGDGVISVIDPDDVAAIAVKTLIEDGHAGKTYRLTSEDAYRATDLAKLLSGVVGRELTIFQGDAVALREALVANGAPGEHAPTLARYFEKVRAGLYATTDTARALLGRAPVAFADWLGRNPPTRPRPG